MTRLLNSFAHPTCTSPLISHRQVGERDGFPFSGKFLIVEGVNDKVDEKCMIVNGNMGGE